MDLYPEGPTERLGDRPAAADPAPNKGIAVAVLLAMLALVISVGAALLAWRALSIKEEGLGTGAGALLTECRCAP
ncbi:hypothetical protein [Actinoplanes sp. N902-109]|uniref:hypothetical protein n=1 Tax=Actinoplanes sp. (strain N902-109) TaxID=649831 RepID=UPI00032952DE|nr:hypothetical protein [Actinoplanes sp. N902-109]AGL19470.1 hypothetical protein L083_5960 [Actinoplanes sp. N902-109]